MLETSNPEKPTETGRQEKLQEKADTFHCSERTSTAALYACMGMVETEGCPPSTHPCAWDPPAHCGGPPERAAGQRCSGGQKRLSGSPKSTLPLNSHPPSSPQGVRQWQGGPPIGPQGSTSPSTTKAGRFSPQPRIKRAKALNCQFK